MKLLVSFFSGIIFSIGLGLAGMLQPSKIIGFLDIFGDWDPSLIFVMIGAIAVHSLAYSFARKKKSPVFDPKFYIPTRKDINGRLIGGAILFGMGWGISGYCPGPGIASLASVHPSSLVFVLSMLVGMIVFNRLSFLNGKKSA